MGSKSNISWTHSTWNPWIGCTVFADECLNCYAADLDRRRFSKTLGGATVENPISHWGRGAPRHQTSQATFEMPLKWNDKPWACNECGHESSEPIGCHPNLKNPACWCEGRLSRRRVFTGSLMDWADQEVPDSWRDRMFDLAERCPNLLFLFLTKRGEAALRYVTDRYGSHAPKNFWWGQSWMHKRPRDIQFLRAMPGPTRFLSAEPFLAPLPDDIGLFGIDWVIFGGESGPDARPCDIRWISYGLKTVRRHASIPFVKQLGSNAVSSNGPVTLRDRAGACMAEWPDYLQVQEVPR